MRCSAHVWDLSEVQVWVPCVYLISAPQLILYSPSCMVKKACVPIKTSAAPNTISVLSLYRALSGVQYHRCSFAEERMRSEFLFVLRIHCLYAIICCKAPGYVVLR